MAISKVQSTNFTAAAGGTVTVNYGSTTTAGNLLIIGYCNFSGTSAPAAPTGWTQVNAVGNGFIGNLNGGFIACYYRLNAPATSSVAFTTAGNGNQIGYYSLMEFSGLSSYEGGNSASNAGTGVPSASYSTTNAGDLVYIMSAASSTAEPTPSGYTSVNSAALSNNIGFTDCFQVKSGTGSVSQWTVSKTGSGCNVEAFVAAGAAAVIHQLGLLGVGV